VGHKRIKFAFPLRLPARETQSAILRADVQHAVAAIVVANAAIRKLPPGIPFFDIDT
jgi:hypothetical protein